MRLTTTSVNPSCSTRCLMISSATVEVLMPAPHATTISLLISGNNFLSDHAQDVGSLKARDWNYLFLGIPPLRGPRGRNRLLVQVKFTPQPSYRVFCSRLSPQC